MSDMLAAKALKHVVYLSIWKQTPHELDPSYLLINLVVLRACFNEQGSPDSTQPRELKGPLADCRGKRGSLERRDISVSDLPRTYRSMKASFAVKNHAMPYFLVKPCWYETGHSLE